MMARKSIVRKENDVILRVTGKLNTKIADLHLHDTDAEVGVDPDHLKLPDDIQIPEIARQIDAPEKVKIRDAIRIIAQVPALSRHEVMPDIRIDRIAENPKLEDRIEMKIDATGILQQEDRNSRGMKIDQIAGDP